jgi:carboxyl-terminal processing protease
MRFLFHLLLLFGWATGLAQPGSTCCKEATDLLALIQKYHVRGALPDSTLSKKIFREVFNTLDPEKKFFSQQDIQQLNIYETVLISQLKSDNGAFLTDLNRAYQRQLTSYKTWLEQTLKTSVDLSTPDKLSIFHFRDARPADNRELLDHRKRLIKYDLLEGMLKRQQADSANKPLLAFEKEVRADLLQKELQSLEKLLNPKEGFDKAIMTGLLKAIAKAFDPHTQYFSQADAGEFKASLSDKAPDFGFEIGENARGEIVVERVVPGGPAWNTNEIHRGDILEAIIDEDGVRKDFAFLDAEEVTEVLREADFTQAELIFRKSDGQTKQVKLIKENLEQIDNIVKGFVLKGKHTLGYINLPGFYTQWENETAKGCAEDVARELVKLKKENIEGLILDLRFNGGGSFHEALGLASIFIDVGPLILYQEKQEPVVTVKDLNKGTIYDGPLIIMVNGFSASASELLAATLQDYNRAVIVGSTTFGKGTGQQILPFPDKPGASLDNATAILKVTADRLYRITGKSYQHKGVKPDIPLVDITASIPERESLYENSLLPDSVTKKIYYTPLPAVAIKPLVEASVKRQQVSEQFNMVNTMTAELLKPIPLKADEYLKHKNSLEHYYREFDLLKSDQKLFTANPLAFDASVLKMDGHKKDSLEKFARQLEESIYLTETFQIMCDYIALKKK